MFGFIAVLVQIVSTLQGNRHSADKMLLYAENHNQVIVSPCFRIRARPVYDNTCMYFAILFVQFGKIVLLLLLLFWPRSPYLEDAHLLKYCSVKPGRMLLMERHQCLEGVHCIRYATLYIVILLFHSTQNFMLFFILIQGSLGCHKPVIAFKMDLASANTMCENMQGFINQLLLFLGFVWEEGVTIV